MLTYLSDRMQVIFQSEPYLVRNVSYLFTQQNAIFKRLKITAIFPARHTVLATQTYSFSSVQLIEMTIFRYTFKFTEENEVKGDSKNKKPATIKGKIAKKKAVCQCVMSGDSTSCH